MNNIANKLLRLLSGLLDSFIGSLFIVLALRQISQSTNLESLMNSVWWAYIAIIFILLLSYFVNAGLISKFGGTIGKLLTGTKIVDKDGQSISFWRAIFRNSIGYILSNLLFGLGHIWLFFDKENRTWHDMMAGTYVMLNKKYVYIFGLIVLAVAIYLNIYISRQVLGNFDNNAHIYSEIAEMVREVFN